MDFYKILEEIMSEKDMSIPDVARACGLSDGTVRSIVARKSQTVSLEVAFKLSSGLNISLERLNGEGNRLIKNAPSDFSEEAKKIAKDYDKLDARGKGAHGFTEIEVFDQPAAAGLGNPVDIPPSHTEQYPSDYVPPKTNFGVLISGTSMEPKIPDGSTVFVQATPALDNGEIGIFVLDGKSYCKQLKKDEETVILHSLNPDAEDVDVPPLSELRTLGRVLGGYDPRTKDMI